MANLATGDFPSASSTMTRPATVDSYVFYAAGVTLA
jgi:hypothetical protein